MSHNEEVFNAEERRELAEEQDVERPAANKKVKGATTARRLRPL